MLVVGFYHKELFNGCFASGYTDEGNGFLSVYPLISVEELCLTSSWHTLFSEINIDSQRLGAPPGRPLFSGGILSQEIFTKLLYKDELH